MTTPIKHSSDDCMIPFCPDCLDNIKQIKYLADNFKGNVPTKSEGLDEERKLPPLAIIDAIDKWVHSQTRFHIADTDGYEVMLTEVAQATKQRDTTRDKAIRGNCNHHSLGYSPYVDTFTFWCKCVNDKEKMKGAKRYKTTRPIEFIVDEEGEIVFLEINVLHQDAVEVTKEENTNG